MTFYKKACSVSLLCTSGTQEVKSDLILHKNFNQNETNLEHSLTTAQKDYW